MLKTEKSTARNGQHLYPYAINKKIDRSGVGAEGGQSFLLRLFSMYCNTCNVMFTVP